MSKVKSCAGCRALVHNSSGGMSCYLRKPHILIDEEYLDKRLDQYVNIKPEGDCKVRTNKDMVEASMKQNLPLDE